MIAFASLAVIQLYMNIINSIKTSFQHFFTPVSHSTSANEAYEVEHLPDVFEGPMQVALPLSIWGQTQCW